MTVVGVNTFPYAWNTPAIDSVRRLADMGYRSFELVCHPPHLPLESYDAGSRRELSALLDHLGAVHSSVNLPSLDHNLASPWPQMRDFSVEQFRQTIDLASDIGISCVVVVPGRLSPLVPAGMEERTAFLRGCIERLLPHAQSRGVRLAIENVPMAAFPDAGTLGTFVRSIGSRDVGVCYDLANAHFYGEDPAAGLRELADLIQVVHVSDTTRTVWRHDPIGMGDVPYAGIPAVLEQIGYDRAIMLEIIDPDPEGAIISSHDLLVQAGYPERTGASV